MKHLLKPTLWLLLGLTLTCWALSYNHPTSLGYSGSYSIWLNIRDGSLYAFAGHFSPFGWWFFNKIDPSWTQWNGNGFGEPCVQLFGLALDTSDSFPGGPAWMIKLPLWIPTLLSATALYLHTRSQKQPKNKTARAFPLDKPIK